MSSWSRGLQYNWCKKKQDIIHVTEHQIQNNQKLAQPIATATSLWDVNFIWYIWEGKINKQEKLLSPSSYSTLLKWWINTSHECVSTMNGIHCEEELWKECKFNFETVHLNYVVTWRGSRNSKKNSKLVHFYQATCIYCSL